MDFVMIMFNRDLQGRLIDLNGSMRTSFLNILDMNSKTLTSNLIDSFFPDNIINIFVGVFSRRIFTSGKIKADDL